MVGAKAQLPPQAMTQKTINTAAAAVAAATSALLLPLHTDLAAQLLHKSGRPAPRAAKPSSSHCCQQLLLLSCCKSRCHCKPTTTLCSMSQHAALL